MLRKAVAMIAMAGAIGHAWADEPTPDQIVTRHMAAFAKHDVDALLRDYADDAEFLLAPGQALHGKAALKQMFSSMPSGANAPVFETKQLPSSGDVGFEHWVMNPGKPGAVEGTDAFVVRNGKIQFQAALGVRPVAESGTAK